jgi:hypothetical protein
MDEDGDHEEQGTHQDSDHTHDDCAASTDAQRNSRGFFQRVRALEQRAEHPAAVERERRQRLNAPISTLSHTSRDTIGPANQSMGVNGS